MNLHAPVPLNLRPCLHEFFLHQAPHTLLLNTHLFQLLTGLALQLMEAVPSLDNGGLSHEELELFEVAG